MRSDWSFGVDHSLFTTYNPTATISIARGNTLAIQVPGAPTLTNLTFVDQQLRTADHHCFTVMKCISRQQGCDVTVQEPETKLLNVQRGSFIQLLPCSNYSTIQMQRFDHRCNMDKLHACDETDCGMLPFYFDYCPIRTESPTTSPPTTESPSIFFTPTSSPVILTRPSSEPTTTVQVIEIEPTTSPMGQDDDNSTIPSVAPTPSPSPHPTTTTTSEPTTHPSTGSSSSPSLVGLSALALVVLIPLGGLLRHTAFIRKMAG